MHRVVGAYVKYLRHSLSLLLRQILKLGQPYVYGMTVFERYAIVKNMFIIHAMNLLLSR